MTFTYDASSFTDKDRVRLRIADTIETPHVFEDEEITELLSSEGDVRFAAAACCRIMATDASKRAKAIQLPGLNLDQGKAVQQLMDLAGRLEAESVQRAVPLSADVYTNTDRWLDAITGAHDADLDRPT